MTWSTRLLAYTFLAAPLGSGILGAYGQDNTQCASTELDWYKNVVGETPCTTYQRLRQICNNDYTVPKLRTSTPGDNCNDQVSECCCNSISWALSMLCYNCQYDAASQTNGVDAGVGGYDSYLGTCKQPKNQTLPNDIQTAVCNKEIKIDRNLYGLFWGNGAWFYTFTKQTMQKDFAVTNNNTFTKCASTTRNGTTTSSGTSTGSSPLATGSESSDSSKSGSGAIIGGVRHPRGPVPLDLSKEYHGARGSLDDESPPMGTITPFSPTNAHSPRYDSDPFAAPTSETYALLPRGLPPSSDASGPSAIDTASGMYPGPGSPGSWVGSARPSRFAPPSSFASQTIDGERHEDGGPAVHLQRSASGRLPPAYRDEWEGSDAGPAPLGSPGSGEGRSGYGFGGGYGAGYGQAGSTYGDGTGSQVGSSVAGGNEVPTSTLRPAYPRDVKVPLVPSNA
ncbi:hypothetical protein C8Q80DRAFT_1266231 [Daedaleopsis nitida]|nr:hypothetical protein C8Q80DRAFT_1266231 [Daedaleopsis nitida]